MIERLGGLALTALLVATTALLWTGPQGTPRHEITTEGTPVAVFTGAAPDAPETAPGAQDGPPPDPAPDGATPTIETPTAASVASTSTTSTTRPPTCPFTVALTLPWQERQAYWDAARAEDRGACPAPWVPALVGGERANTEGLPAGATGGGVCWGEHGGPVPQPDPYCPHNWGPRPPENPTPIGIKARLP